MTLGGPELRGETWTWSGSAGGVEVRFTGRGPGGEREEVLHRIEAGASEVPPVAWLKQVHSDVALPASAGRCGEGDALYTREAGLALAVATADCVPVLVVMGDGRIAAIHAGWRGLVNGVIAATLAAMGGPSLGEAGGSMGKAAAGGVGSRSGEALGQGARAWIGPAIGPCCYEVGAEVAEAVIAASGAEVARPGANGKPHLDLVLAARIQLERLGFDGSAVFSIPLCTRCAEEKLYSYRREGKGAGRNVAFIWRRSERLER